MYCCPCERMFVSMYSSSRSDIDSAKGRESPLPPAAEKPDSKANFHHLKPQGSGSGRKLPVKEPTEASVPFTQPTGGSSGAQRQNSAEIAANLVSEDLQALNLEGYGPSRPQNAPDTTASDYHKRQSTTSVETHRSVQTTTQILVKNGVVENTQHSLQFAPILRAIVSDILEVVSKAPGAQREEFSRLESILQSLKAFCASKRLDASPSPAERLTQGIKDSNFLPPFVKASLGGSNSSSLAHPSGPNASPVNSNCKGPTGANVWVIKGDSVWRLGEGSQVSSGRLEVGEDGIVVLDRTCVGFTLKDVVLKGGMLVCMGLGCDVTLSNTQFKDCSLVVLGGAHAWVHACEFKRRSRWHPAAHVHVHGPHSCVEIQNDTDTLSKIAGGSRAVVVQQKGCFKAQNLHITGVAASGIEVCGGGSKAELFNCSFYDFSAAFSKTTDSTAVLAHCKGNATLHNACMHGMHVGAHAMSSAQVNLHNCKISETKRSGVVLEAGGLGEMRNTEVSEAGGDGVEVRGEGSRCSAFDCTLMHNVLSGIVVSNNAKASLCGCKTTGNKQLGGYVSQHGGAVTMMSCRSAFDFRGLYALGASLFADHSVVTGALRGVLRAEHGSEVGLSNCIFEKCEYEEHPAVAIADPGTMLTWLEGEIHTMKSSCMEVSKGARARVVRVTIAKSLKDCGLRVLDQGTVVEVEGCSFRENMGVGVCTSKCAKVSLKECKWSGNGTYVGQHEGEDLAECR